MLSFCEKIELHLTDEEKRRGRVREWLPLQEAIDFFRNSKEEIRIWVRSDLVFWEMEIWAMQS